MGLVNFNVVAVMAAFNGSFVDGWTDNLIKSCADFGNLPYSDVVSQQGKYPRDLYGYRYIVGKPLPSDCAFRSVGIKSVGDLARVYVNRLRLALVRVGIDWDGLQVVDAAIKHYSTQLPSRETVFAPKDLASMSLFPKSLPVAPEYFIDGDYDQPGGFVRLGGYVHCLTVCKLLVEIARP
jgi:hypothetical protein